MVIIIRMNVLLGKETACPTKYSPEILTSIERRLSRKSLGLADDERSFIGCDYWNAYELSWLNSHGLPQVGIASIKAYANSKCIVESKSLKLYLFSFNQERFASMEQLRQTITDDLAAAFGGFVEVKIHGPHARVSTSCPVALLGECIDRAEVDIEHYEYKPELLQVDGDDVVSEMLYSHVFRSNCPVTGQPDWANIWIAYRGQKLCRKALLKYLVSYRNAQEFHEHCVEQIFLDIAKVSQAEELTVGGFFTRRGGLDINPMRSLKPVSDNAMALIEQFELSGFKTFRQ